MTGEPAFQPSEAARLVTKDTFFRALDSLRPERAIIGPVSEGGHAAFRRVDSAAGLQMDYLSTMEPPGKRFLLRPREDLLYFDPARGMAVSEAPAEAPKSVIVGLHPCDVHAVLYLDRTFACDPWYQARRLNTMLVALNCRGADEYCFCSSVGTGPHLEVEHGYDALLTDLGDSYLLELRSGGAREAFGRAGAPAGAEAMGMKAAEKEKAASTVTRHIETRGLDGLFLASLDHEVWRRTADERCLSCANCVMVCPTCFCHDYTDRVGMDLGRVTRFRQWDACQDARFAAVHGGNFRGSRAARLRQFVTHKLDYSRQYGTVGTVGCGRCIRWCPTGIDLTEIAGELRRSSGGKPPRAS
ncbi:MAG: hypothetical protein Kow0025_22640 [Thermodesulfovibrionales bacterium]